MRWARYEQMHVVLADVPLDDLNLELRADIPHNLPQTDAYVRLQQLFAVLRDPHKVVLQVNVVTQPRLPCFKLGIRFGRPDILKRFLQSGRTGFYFAVTREGEIGAGDSIEPVDRANEWGLTVADVVNLYTVDGKNQELLRRATQSATLPESWKEYFRKRLWEPDASGT